MNERRHDRESLIRALQDPHCYPHTVDQVQLRQTPLSWVLLAGDFAYKIKKPVKLDFVDFSSLSLRYEACLAELRLNRRFAAALYLDVVAVTGPLESPRIGGDAAPIEYAVKMRRFANKDELSSLLEDERIDAPELAAFGAQLARIHAQSSRVDSREATATALVTAARNVDELRRLRPGDERAIRVGHWLQAEGERLRETLERRAAGGCVRECHGDLHAGNIVRYEGELVAFDCLEFDRNLRCIDVASDVAFAFMDLQVRERQSLAYAFLNGWLEENGDYAACSVLRYFVVHRALVRAKVSTLADDQAFAGRYLDFADACLQQTAAMLAITCGLSGSGKTWLSGQALLRVPAIRIRSDVERKRLAGGERPDDLYSAQFTERVYAQLRERAQGLLEAGHSVIVDAAFLNRDERHSFMSVAADRHATFVILDCSAPEAELRRRLSQRQKDGKDASDADVAVMEHQCEVRDEFTSAERPFLVEAQTADPASVERALMSLAQRALRSAG